MTRTVKALAKSQLPTPCRANAPRFRQITRRSAHPQRVHDDPLHRRSEPERLYSRGRIFARVQPDKTHVATSRCEILNAVNATPQPSPGLKRQRACSRSCSFQIFRAFTLSLIVLCTRTPLVAQAPTNPVAQTSAALRNQDFDEALRLTAAALKATPKDPRLLTLRGVAYTGKNQPALALAAYQRALKLAPDYLPALEAAAQIAYQQHDAQARPLLDRIVALHPDEPTANAMLGALDYSQHQCTAAAQHFERARPALARQPAALMQYGACLAELNRLPDAVSLFEQAAALTPPADPAAFNAAHYNLALARFNAQQPDQALEALAPLITSPNPPEDALTLAADIAETKSHTQHAVELLRKAILTHPKDKAAYLQFAYLSYKHSSMQVGIDMLNIGVEQMPQQAELYLARGVLYSQTSDINQAAADFDTAARLAPNLSFAAAAQGIAHSQAHDASAALKTFRATAKQHPDDSLTQYLLAEELSNQAPAPGTPAFEESIAAAQKSLALDPNRIEAYDLLAALYLRAGDTTHAIEESQAALALDPDDEQALYHQILALRKSDRRSEVPALVERMMKVRQSKAAEATPKVYRLVEAAPGSAPGSAP